MQPEDMPDAFLSYAREDDRILNKFITGFRNRLADEVRLQTGEPFTIFQDNQTMLWGDNWQEVIEAAVGGARFLIPIVTPSFLGSGYCREEVELFRRAEQRRGRADLILPVHLVQTDAVTDKRLRGADAVADLLSGRTMPDLTALSRRSIASPLVKQTIAELARHIKERLARDRTGGAGPTRPPPDVPALPDFVPVPVQDRVGVLDDLKAALAQPGTVAIELYGEPGIGKTAIAVQLAHDLARERTARYLTATGNPAVTVNSVLESLARAVPDPEDHDRLLERLAGPEMDLLTRLDEVLDRLGRQPVLLVVDDAQELLSGGALPDDGLGLLLAELAGHHGHRVQLLFVTAEPLPLRGLARVRVAEGLPSPFFGRLLADLEATRAVGLATLPEPELQRVTGGRPRSAELIYGIRAGQSPPAYDPLPAGAGPPGLEAALLDSLDEAGAGVLQALAVYGRPARADAVAHLAELPEPEVGAILAELVRRRVVRRHGDRHHLPAAEAERLTVALAPGTLAERRRHAARFLEAAARGRPAGCLADLADALDAIDLHVSAGNASHALALMTDLDERHLKEWGHSDVLTPWLRRLSGELTDLGEQVQNAALLGRALAHQGRLDQAILTLYAAGRLNNALRSTDNQLTLLVQLGGYHFRAGEVRRAAARYGDALRAAPAGHRMIAAAWAGLALCRAETGDFTAALDGIGTARQAVGGDASGSELLRVRLRLSEAAIRLELGERGCLELAREAGDTARRAGADVLGARCDEVLARAWMLRDRREDALAAAAAAYRVGTRVGSPELTRTAGTTLATVRLWRGEIEPALVAARVAARFRRNPLVAEAIAVKGVAAYRTGRDDRLAAAAFREAAQRARDLLDRQPGSYRLHETHGLALAGLALQDGGDEEAAVAAYRRAIAVDHDVPGAARRRQVLFAALTAEESDRVLPRLRDLLG
ncbi:hypothetical protein GCM10020358_67100 [Amorphoplanes nipponensis]|uniref:TIR domain-containing protein n=1 Tax=Actinoplanes nipponensis TaxID=135950 RepID=A0A919JQ95_9ACTN|nr:AAA family ATPase [Actinoplanes nipponensis]GIE53798.1 hypothetical protein Ani05nite_73320 [Actinoplanes nipponensis]